MSEPMSNPTPSTPAPISPPPEPTRKPRRRLFRWVAWFGVFLLLAFVALSVWTILRPGPAAYALIQISRQPPSIVYSQARDSNNSQDFDSYGRGQATLVKSRLVLSAALRNPKLAASFAKIAKIKYPINWLERHLQVSFDKDAGLLRIALQSGPPEVRVALVDAVTDAYLEEVVIKENDVKGHRVRKLMELYVRTQEELRSKRKTLKEMAKGVGGLNNRFMTAKQKLDEESLRTLGNELLANRSALRKVQVKLALAERQDQQAERARYQNELAYLKEMDKKLQADFEQAAHSVQDLGGQSVELEFFENEVAGIEALTREIWQQKSKLEIEVEAPVRIRHFQDAFLEDHRNWQDVLSDWLQDLW